jgi:hypothetical protein
MWFYYVLIICFTAADESPLIANSSNDGHIKNPKIPPCESSEVGNTVGSQGQSSVSTVDPLTSSIADLKTEESSIVHGDGFSGLSSDSSLSKATVDPLASSIADLKTEESSIVHGDGFYGLSSDSSVSKAEAVPEVLPEKNIYAAENVTDYSLICDEKESNLKGSDEVN